MAATKTATSRCAVLLALAALTAPLVGTSTCALAQDAAPVPVLAAPISGAEIRQELRRFAEMGRVLYVAAHPDDENTQLITYLARIYL
jgi:CelD/BcsL family acetyltransferase involved in cellulose biosynthesis